MAVKTIVSNKKVRFEYFVEDTLEAGIVLVGSEVKSLREAKVSLEESFIHVDRNMEVFLVNAYIGEYRQANIQNHDTRQSRKLLLKKKQIQKLENEVARKGFTLMPLKMYFKHSLVKVSVALCRGKKQHDKREVLKERDAKREMDRVKKAYQA